MNTELRSETICVVGLGYVGMPLAHALASEHWRVIGMDVNQQRVKELIDGRDSTDELTSEQLSQITMDYTTDPTRISEADVVIVTVPTPIDQSNTPDLSIVRSASEMVGKHLKRGALVIYESTVYPGVTEEICVPIIEKVSGMTCGSDWKVGYSPERVNPGDKKHTIATVTKVVSAMDEESQSVARRVYESICKAGIHMTPNIKTAEAAKVIENIQRDLNIALMNELSLIFDRVGVDTTEVIDAAATKWNFHRYTPGLVGGHCIGVDPYYLTYRAAELGYHPQVILAGRRVNDSMADHVANLCIASLAKTQKPIARAKVLVLGATFKEDVPDTRNSKVSNLVKKLLEYNVRVMIYDPIVENRDRDQFPGEWIESLNDLNDLDAVILASPHKQFCEQPLEQYASMMAGTPILLDIKSALDRAEAEKHGILYKSL